MPLLSTLYLPQWQSRVPIRRVLLVRAQKRKFTGKLLAHSSVLSYHVAYTSSMLLNIPSQPRVSFQVLSAYLVLSTARLVLGRGLPEGVWPFALTAAILSMLSIIVKMRYATKWWQKLIPSGVSFAIGMVILKPPM